MLREAKEHLLGHGVDIFRQRDHVVSQSLHFNDVDGNRIDVFVDADPAIWRADPGKVANSAPLEL
ncbi:MAG: catechol 2,3-dioxygenase [Gammaproteobacteria bacterium]|jgi:catechol 2,3-dioxygenase